MRRYSTIRSRACNHEMFYFNDALDTFYLWLYCVRHMVKDHSGSEKGIYIYTIRKHTHINIFFISTGHMAIKLKYFYKTYINENN